ncbi:MAG: uncharacterized protein QOK47_1317 [Actinomycetota bacterium]|jgi:uncharacterized membrane protein (UPF0127 family)|nr:uncharacterized protein [Actinomycetota bacterium]
MLSCFRGNLLQVNTDPALWFGEEVVARRIRFADSAWGRMRGLMFVPHMPPDEALVLDPARQVHTFGMRFNIDVIFCDDEWNVVHLVRRMRPGRITRWVRHGRRVIELPGGAVPQALSAGDRLELR